MIADGRVAVNGRPVTTQGCCVDPDADRIQVDGRAVQTERKLYLAFNKPRGVLCTCRDTHGRRTVLDCLPDFKTRLFPVGRLDQDSEGLLLVTNDGAFALALTHPRHEAPKTYQVLLNGTLSPAQVARLLAGVVSEGQQLRASAVTVMEGRRDAYLIVLHEGRKRQIRRMIEGVGAKVVRLRRVAIGPLELGGLREGAWRRLTEAEREALMTAG
jgi:pseudouridine synthase